MDVGAAFNAEEPIVEANLTGVLKDDKRPAGGSYLASSGCCERLTSGKGTPSCLLWAAYVKEKT